jgi:Rps23 Pro-64 3,4-dihydroxylase Tpa1-like proline 4-hydroxylase
MIDTSLEAQGKSEKTTHNITAKGIFNYSYWMKQAEERRLEYQTDRPFPHIILEDFLTSEALRETAAEYVKVDWQNYRHYNENKQGGNVRKLPPTISAVLTELNSPRFLQFLESVTGIRDLIADDSLGSGGIHQSQRGGFLNIHADFTVHPYHHNWRRRINVLIYLNEQWPEEWGGKLELWARDMSECQRKVAPIFNRCVIFNTDETSFHGHPEPMTCPEGVKRKSIALYYYTLDKEAVAISTEYRSRPSDSSFKSILIFFDKTILRIFHKVKATLKLPDSVITSFMGLFRKK